MEKTQMSTQFMLWLLPCILLGVAAVFQLITQRRKKVCVRPMVRHGKRIMASGFALGSLWYFYRLAVPGHEFYIPWGAAAFSLAALGSIVANADRFIRGQEDAPTGSR